DCFRDPPLLSPGRCLPQAACRIRGQTERRATPARDTGSRPGGHAGQEKRGALAMRRLSPTPTSPYDSCARKTLHSALCHLLQTEFPGVFGPAITRLFADRISEIVERFLPARTCFKMGQVFWTAVAVDDPPARGKRIENTRLVPVVLDLVTA